VFLSEPSPCSYSRLKVDRPELAPQSGRSALREQFGRKWSLDG
jgi:hypothetical protein